MKTILTGASGYVGGILLRALRQDGHETVAWSRRECPPPWQKYELGKPLTKEMWSGCEALIHSAHDFSAQGWQENDQANVQPSLDLLRSAHQAGTRILVYISSFSSFDGTRSDYGKAKLAVEKEWLAHNGIVIRPGLVWGDRSGGVMGALERLVMRLPVVPCLSGPRGLPQYLVHEDDLASAVLDALNTPSMPGGQIVEAAYPDPVPLEKILSSLALRHGRRPIFPSVPWRLAMAALKSAEFLGIHPPFRSDSLTGLVHSTPSLLTEEPNLQRRRFRPFP